MNLVVSDLPKRGLIAGTEEVFCKTAEHFVDKMERYLGEKG